MSLPGLHDPSLAVLPVAVGIEQVVAHRAWRQAREEALAALLEGCRLILLVGSPGTGKSLLLDELAQTLRAKGRQVLLLPRGDVLPDFAEVGWAPSRADTPRVVLVDEANRLTDGVFELLGRLGSCSLVMAGLPALIDEHADGLPGSRSVHLRPLAPDEVPAFMAARLAQIGSPAETFGPDALSRLAELSDGAPRLINTLAGTAHFLAGLEGASTVGGAHVVEAAALRGDVAVPGSTVADTREAEPGSGDAASSGVAEAAAGPDPVGAAHPPQCAPPPPPPPARTVAPVTPSLARPPPPPPRLVHLISSQAGRARTVFGAGAAVLAACVCLTLWQAGRPRPDPAPQVASQQAATALPADAPPVTEPDGPAPPPPATALADGPKLDPSPALADARPVVQPPADAPPPPPVAASAGAGEAADTGEPPAPTRAEAADAIAPDDAVLLEPSAPTPPGQQQQRAEAEREQPGPSPAPEATPVRPAPMPAPLPSPVSTVEALPNAAPAYVVLRYPRKSAEAASRASGIAAALRNAGFAVEGPVPAPLDEAGPSSTVRYFFAEDRDTALDVLRAAGLPGGAAPLAADPASGQGQWPRPGTIHLVLSPQQRWPAAAAAAERDQVGRAARPVVPISTGEADVVHP